MLWSSYEKQHQRRKTKEIEVTRFDDFRGACAIQLLIQQMVAQQYFAGFNTVFRGVLELKCNENIVENTAYVAATIKAINHGYVSSNRSDIGEFLAG